MAERQCDVIVIGAGPAGENVAGRAVRGGLSAAIVEAELVGGECSLWALASGASRQTERPAFVPVRSGGRSAFTNAAGGEPPAARFGWKRSGADVRARD